MTASTSQAVPQRPSVRSPSPPRKSASPPSKRDLASWWSGFKKKTRKEEEKIEAPIGIFGVPLSVSIKYANVAISLQNQNGESYVYGYVPIIVAKCGVYLKENGTDIHGIFRLPGSAKRIKELQAAFDSPDRYGRGLDWSGYTVHDAGSIFRRYINALPEPVIPLDFYEKYRDPIRNHQKVASDDPDLGPDTLPAEQFDHQATIATYQRLIKELPSLNRQLLLYLLDLLAVFSSKSEVNGMDQFNLSAVFQPGILSHPIHDLKPVEYKLSQNVLVYLIVNQDHFLFGMEGTQSDSKAVAHVQSGTQRQPSTPNKAIYAGLGRSASNASAGGESLRKTSAIRRTASVSSKNSNLSNQPSISGPPTPSSPLIITSSNRSHMATPRRSPGLSSPRFAKNFPSEQVTPTTPTAQPVITAIAIGEDPVAETAATVQSTSSEIPATTQAFEESSILPTSATTANPEGPESSHGKPSHLAMPEAGPGAESAIPAVATPNKERKSFFAKSPSSDTEKRDAKPINKLKKKTRPNDGATSASAQSSTVSLQGHQEGEPRTAPGSPLAMPAAGTGTIPTLMNTAASPQGEQPPILDETENPSSFAMPHMGGSSHPGSPSVRPAKSPVPSMHSGLGHEVSEDEPSALDGSEKVKQRRSRWRLSTSTKKDKEHETIPTTPSTSKLDSAVVAEDGHPMIGSPERKPRKSMTKDSQMTGTTDTSQPSALTLSSNESGQQHGIKDKEGDGEGKEKRGLFGRIKDKVIHSKDDHKKDSNKESFDTVLSPREEKNASSHALGEQEASTKTSTHDTTATGDDIAKTTTAQQSVAEAEGGHVSEDAKALAPAPTAL